MINSWVIDAVTTDIDRAIHYTLLWGLDGIDLLVLDESRVPDVNEPRLRRRLGEYEIDVTSIDPGYFEGSVSDRADWLNDLAMLPEALRFCDRIGCKRILVGSFAAGEATAQAVEPMRRAAEAVAAHGVELCICTGPDEGIRTPEAAAELVEAVDVEGVGFMWDPAENLRAGVPSDASPDVLRYVSYVRCSDGRLVNGNWTWTAMGEGDVGWKDVMARLREVGYTGGFSLDVRLDPKPKTGLRDATTLIQLVRGAGFKDA